MKKTRRTTRSRIRLAPRTRTRLRMTMKQAYVASAVAVLLIAGGLTVFLNLGNHENAMASASGDYRAKATGNWNATATWEKYNGSSWVAATATPTSADGVITIRSPYTVTVTAPVSVDQVVINSGGQITLNSATTLTFAAGSGTDLDVSGIFKNAGTVTLVGGATIVFQSGGKYQHNFTTSAGTIPTATWMSGSTCEIIGYTSNSSAPSGLQSFYNFTWNCPSQSADINLGGGLTTVSGDFTLTTTNSKQLILSGNTNTLSVGGDFTLSSGTFVCAMASNATPAINISGNFFQTGGTFSVVQGSNATGTINLYGNVSRTGGTITVGGNSSTNAQLYFKKSGTQTYSTSGAAISGYVDFTVNSGAILDLDNNVLGGKNFTLASGGGLKIGSPAGITSSGNTGNIQALGSRSFSTGANYTYDGTGAQSDGNGLPATVSNLTLNNSAGLTLTSPVSVSNILTLTSGIISTGSNELHVTNNSTTSIAGFSATNYVIGNLRRTVSSSGTYNFPLGTSANYELITLTLSGAGPFTTILGTFNNSNPLLAALPLLNVIVGGLTIDKMLNYGYWTMTPNLPMLLGTYSVTVNEKGASNPAGTAYNYTLLKRSSPLLSWQSLGTNLASSVLSNVVSAGRSGLSGFSEFAVAYGEYLNFDNSVLISGVDGQVDAVYKFPDVCYNVDAWVQVMSMTGGATLGSVDGTSAGYNEAWQPFVGIAPNATSSILWKLTFKVAGTATDTIMPYLTITGVDVDGNSSLHETIEASTPYSYTVDNPTNLSVAHTGLGYKATANSVDLSGIDTSQHEAMFQINYQNINSFEYRTGGVSTTGTLTVRQNSLYFKSFLTGSPSALPIKLIYFNAKLSEGVVKFDWATAAEINNNFFTIERSEDGEHFEALQTKPGAGNSTTTLYYKAADQSPLTDYSYYRLKQTDYDGHYSYSEIQTVKNGSGDKAQSEEALTVKSVYPNPFTTSFKLNFMIKSAVIVDFTLMNTSGKVVAQAKIQADEGYNTYEFLDDRDLEKGIYFAVLNYNDQRQIQKIIKN